MIEKITNGDEQLAIIIRRDFSKDGIEFFTPQEYSQQLAYMKREKGHVIPPHAHNIISREIHLTQEVLLVRSGKIRVDFYTKDRQYLKSAILEQGDIILLASGAHGFRMLEETEMIEVKQGPYAGEDDKVRFDPAREEQIRFL